MLSIDTNNDTGWEPSFEFMISEFFRGNKCKKKKEIKVFRH